MFPSFRLVTYGKFMWKMNCADASIRHITAVKTKLYCVPVLASMIMWRQLLEQKWKQNSSSDSGTSISAVYDNTHTKQKPWFTLLHVKTWAAYITSDFIEKSIFYRAIEKCLHRFMYPVWLKDFSKTDLAQGLLQEPFRNSVYTKAIQTEKERGRTNS